MEFEFSRIGTTPPFFVAVHHVLSRATTRKIMASDFIAISWEFFIKSVFGHFQHDLHNILDHGHVDHGDHNQLIDKLHHHLTTSALLCFSSSSSSSSSVCLFGGQFGTPGWSGRLTTRIIATPPPPGFFFQQ
jgi:hypothetical protein